MDKDVGNYKFLKLSPFLLLFCTIFMCIGYASINSIVGKIEGSVSAQVQEGIFITDVKLYSNVNANTQSSKINYYYQTMMNSSVVLSSADANSSITYKVNIYNSYDIDYIYKGVSHTENLYDNLGITFEVSGLEIGEKITAKSHVEVLITFSYLNNTLASSNILNSYLNFVFEEETKDIYATDEIIELAKNDTTNLYYDTTSDKNLRYIGADPNNYVLFNNQLWRIIGVFNNVDDGTGVKEKRLKIIKDSVFTATAWDSKPSGTGSSTSEYGSNDWTDSRLQITMNSGAYWVNGIGLCPYGEQCDLTSVGLTDDAKKLISPAKWNLGGVSNYKVTSALQLYNNEKGTNVYSGRPTTWVGNVALMYPSDYGFATSGGSSNKRQQCWAMNLMNWSNDCKNNNWILTGSLDGLNRSSIWTLTPYNNKADQVVHIGESTCSNYAICQNSVYPVVYLDAKVVIKSGDGTSGNPYVMSLNSGTSSADEIKHVWLGDSLMRGYGNGDKGFAEYFASLTGENNYYNWSFSGSTISTNTRLYSESDPSGVYDASLIIGKVVEYLSSDAEKYNMADTDIFVMNGGINDIVGFLNSMYVSEQKEIGTVDTTITTPTTGDTVVSDFENILYDLKTNFPNAKVLYVNTMDYSVEGFQNLIYAIVVKGNTVDDLNAWFGTNYSSVEEARDKIIEAFTNGTYGAGAYIPKLVNRSNELFPEIQKALKKYGYEYLDLSGYIRATNTDYLQSDNLHLNDTGYSNLTPYIIDKVNEMLN